MGCIDCGNNKQHASKPTKHLSDDLKDKLLTRSDSYALMREWLITNYWGASRKVNDTIMALAKILLMIAWSDILIHLISGAFQCLEKLTETNLTLGVELNNCLYSRRHMQQ